MNKGFIPKKKYREIADFVPICWLDVVIKKGDSFLLVKRKELPAKGKWWLVGGRVYWGESLLQTVKRKLREEVNIKSFGKVEFLGIKEMFFKKGLLGKPICGIANVFLVQVNEKDVKNIKVDETSSDFKWFKKIEKSFDPYLKQFLKLSGF